jgi:hypothetical protein
MALRQVRSIFCIFILLFNSVTQASIPFTWIKGLYAVTKPECAYLSPINGLVWSQGIVENMYRYGDDADATIRLIKELFYLQRDEVSFVPTVREDKPAAFWGPLQGGKILAVMQKHRNAEQYDQKKCKAELQQVMSAFRADPVMKDKDAMRAALRAQVGGAQIERIHKSIATLNSELSKKVSEQKVQGLLSDQSQAQYNELVAGIGQKKATGAAITADTKAIQLLLRNEIKQLEVQKRAVQTERKKDKSFGALQRKLDMLDTLFDDQAYATLAELLAAAIQESLPGDTQKYMPYTIEQILLAFVWVKANPHEKPENPKQDFIDFFNALSTCIDTQQLATWLHEGPYERDDHMRCKKMLAAPGAAEFIVRNYELIVFSAQAHKVWDQKLPEIFSGRTAYYLYNGVLYAFPDCGETSLRIFCNINFRDQEQHIFSTAYLQEKAVQDAQRQEPIALIPDLLLIGFYKRHPSTTNVTAQALYDEWTQVVENRSGVNYTLPVEKPVYEIKPGLTNILEVFNHLLFGNNATYRALSKKEQLDLVCAKISRNNATLTWKAKDDVDVNALEFVELEFTIKMPKDTATFSWRFQEKHFVIPYQQQTSYPIALPPLITLTSYFKQDALTSLVAYNALSGYVTTANFEQLFYATQPNEARPLWPTIVMLAPLYAQYNKDWMVRIALASIDARDSRMKGVLQKIIEAYLYANKALGVEFIMGTITSIDKNVAQIRNFVASLIPSLPQSVFADKSLEFLFEQDQYDDYDADFIQKRINALSNEDAIRAVAVEIIDKNIETFTDVMQDKLKQSKEGTTIADLSHKILKNNSQNWFVVVGNWLEMSTDDTVTAALITQIITYNRVLLFDQAKKKVPTLAPIAQEELVKNIVQYKIRSWYDVAHSYIGRMDDDSKLLLVAQFILQQKIRELFGVVREKLLAIKNPDFNDRVQKLLLSLKNQ